MTHRKLILVYRTLQMNVEVSATLNGCSAAIGPEVPGMQKHWYISLQELVVSSDLKKC